MKQATTTQPVRSATRALGAFGWLVIAATSACGSGATHSERSGANAFTTGSAAGAGRDAGAAVPPRDAGVGASGSSVSGATSAAGRRGSGGGGAGETKGAAAGGSGAGGSGAAGIAGNGAAGTPAYDAHRDPNAAGILIHVTNACPFPLFIHAAGKGAVLDPDNKQLMTGESEDYTAPDDWSAARVTAYGEAPDAQGHPQRELDKVEMTLGKKTINYNITYVDWLGLPVEMIALGSGGDCKRVGCYMPVADVATRCPAGLLSGSKCRSAGSFCADSANQAGAFCHALDAQIASCASDAQRYPQCAGASGATTGQVYGCAGFFGGSPKWCAALNRGMLDEPDNGDSSAYYTHPPFNAYAQWVHSVCPGIYAFPYDDYGKSNESGFHACAGGRQLDITFCPAG